MAKKNYGKSVRTRLLNLMNDTGYKYMYLLSRYFNERLLYRVFVSQYKDNFLLKGGSLIYAISGLEARPTVDADFMPERISRDRECLAGVFQEIISIPCDEDGVTFDAEALSLSR
jgi:predicted nucleotidyltransferase component of viral defense system